MTTTAVERGLRVAVCVVLCGIAFELHQQAQLARAPPTRSARCDLPSIGPTAVQTRAHKPTWHATKQKDDLPVCEFSSTVIFRYPFICIFGFRSALVYVGGATLGEEVFEQTSLFALAILGHDPLLSLPPEVGQLSSVQILACTQALEGTLPSELGRLTKLVHLYLPFNSLYGTIPSQMGLLTPLKVLSLRSQDGDLTMGAVPSQLLLLTALETFAPLLGAGSGTMPSQVGLLTSLRSLYLKNGALPGSIPSELGLLTKLTDLDLSRNLLTGTIPTACSALTMLKAMDLSENSLDGTVPSELGLLTLLSLLDLHQCQLSGTLPTQLSLLTGLEKFVAYRNELSGTIPDSMWEFPLVQLRVQDNADLGGTIPTTVGLLTALEYLELGSMAVEGTLPTQMSLLSSLEILALSSTQLTGTFPSLVALTRLSTLLVADNDFNGPLPELPASLLELECDYSGLQDSACERNNNKFLDMVSFAVVCALMGVAALTISGIAVFTARHRHNKVVRATNPRLSLLILLGLFLVAMSLLPYGVACLDLEGSVRDPACRSVVFLLGNGLVLVLSAISARNFPIWRIFDNDRMVSVSFSTRQLLRPPALAALLQLLLGIPLSARTSAKTSFGCTVDAEASVIFAQVFYVLALTALTCWLCFKIRDVPSEFNDGNQLAKATYVMASFGSTMMVLAAASNNPQTSFLAYSLGLLVCVVAYVVFVFGPKVLAARADLRNKLSPNAVLYNSDIDTKTKAGASMDMSK